MSDAGVPIDRGVHQPYFVVGSVRSGTTMLRLMLDHHPAVTCFGEFEYIVDRVGDDGTWPEMASFRAWLEGERRFVAHGMKCDPDLPFPDMAQSLLDQQRQRTGKPIVGAAVHRHFDRLLKIWPGARLIYLQRDGRDVARSCMNMGWAANLWYGAAWWLESERLWAALKPRMPRDQWLEVRYEELVNDPAAGLEPVCRLLGVDYDPSMLTYPQHSTYGPPDPKLVYQWRSKMSDRELGLIEARLGDALRAGGYEPSGNPVPHIGGAARLRLWLHNRVGMVRNRVKRYGLRLWMEDVLTRRLGWDAWRKRVRERLNRVDIAHLK